MSRYTQRVLTPKQVRRRSQELPPVEAAILHINSVLDDPIKRRAASAGRSVGDIVHISMGMKLTPQDAFELQERCRSAGWTSGQVIVWQDRTAVCMHTRDTKWDSHYNGKPLDKVLAKEQAAAQAKERPQEALAA